MRRLYLFALFLVTYEFTTYSANDMIMPGMIQVVNDFHASLAFVASSLSLYILGNCAFILPGGFLSERYGKRYVMISGNLLFFLFTIIIIFSQSIHQFMFLRFLQGGGLAIIAIGYALIHENFNDKDAIKLTALMANISLLAPLLGPAIGSAIVNYSSWHYIFVITALLSLITLLGLYRYTPNNQEHNMTINLQNVGTQYWQILKNTKFLKGTLCVIFIVMPLLLWISQAPNIILFRLHLNYFYFAIYQLISVSGLIIASLSMQFIAGKFRIYSLIKNGSLLTLLGILICVIGSNSIIAVVLGLMLYNFGVGIANGCIIRLIMSTKEFSQGMVASLFGFVQTLGFVIGIELCNIICNYFNYSIVSFTITALMFTIISVLLINNYIQYYREREWE